MPKRSVEDMEALFGRAVVPVENLERDLACLVEAEEARILASIDDIQGGAFSGRVEVAGFDSSDKPTFRYVAHAAMLGALARIGYLEDYYEAVEGSIAGRGLPEHVLANGWELMLPMRDGRRPIIKYRPSDESGDEGIDDTAGYRYSLAIYTQGKVAAVEPQRVGRRRRRRRS